MLLWPLLLILVLLIRLDSPGPSLFRQVRRGHRGRPFRLLKFRTMVVDAERRLDELESSNESCGGVLFKIRDDPRVTRLGDFLRRTSLDELPQLINVLKGEMSLVGPRPSRSATASGCGMSTHRAPHAGSRCYPGLPAPGRSPAAASWITARWSISIATTPRPGRSPGTSGSSPGPSPSCSTAAAPIEASPGFSETLQSTKSAGRRRSGPRDAGRFRTRGDPVKGASDEQVDASVRDGSGALPGGRAGGASPGASGRPRRNGPDRGDDGRPGVGGDPLRQPPGGEPHVASIPVRDQLDRHRQRQLYLQPEPRLDLPGPGDQ